jgi:hypothetical protein
MRQWLAKYIKKHEKVVLVLWTTFLFVVHFVPGNALPDENWMTIMHMDKLIHFGLFFISSFIYSQLILTSNRNEWFFIFLVSPWFFEMSQTAFGMGRTFDVGDVAIDYLSILLFFLI